MVWLEFCSRLGCEEFYWCIGLFWTWIHRSILDLCQNAFIFVILWNEIIYLWQYIYIYIYINKCSMEQISSLDCWERNFIISFFPFNFPMLSLYLILNFSLLCVIISSSCMSIALIHEYPLSPVYNKIFSPLAFYKDWPTYPWVYTFTILW